MRQMPKSAHAATKRKLEKAVSLIKEARKHEEKGIKSMKAKKRR